MVTTVRRAAKLLPLNLSVSHNKPPTQLLPSEAMVAEDEQLEHMLH
jgi:hypothetical protein